MALHGSGTASAVQGSNVIKGSADCGWLDPGNQIATGCSFNFSSEIPVYTVTNVYADGAGVPTIELSAPYGGTDKVAAEYRICRDFTLHLGLEEVHASDTKWTPFYLNALRRIDQEIQNLKTGTAGGNIDGGVLP